MATLARQLIRKLSDYPLRPETEEKVGKLHKEYFEELEGEEEGKEKENKEDDKEDEEKEEE
jgi:hypothetical protein